MLSVIESVSEADYDQPYKIHVTYSNLMEKKNDEEVNKFVPSKKESQMLKKRKTMSRKSLAQASDQHLAKYTSKSSALKDVSLTGDKIFKEKIWNLNLENCYSTAAYYFKISNRNIKIMHFMDGSFSQKAYFFTSDPMIRSTKVYLCWFYTMLTFLEPSNSADTSISRSSLKFNLVMWIEMIILCYFLIDMALRTQYMIIASKLKGFKEVFLDELFLVHFT